MNGTYVKDILLECLRLLLHKPAVKGKLPTKKCRKRDLYRYEPPIEVGSNEVALRLVISTDLHEPCKVELSQLEPIFIDDLTIETRHTGRILYLRVLINCAAVCGTMLGVEDGQGGYMSLMIECHDRNAESIKTWPSQTVFAVKEPYTYATDFSAPPQLRVFHHSDLVRIIPGVHKAPEALALVKHVANDSSAMRRTMGNDAHRKGQYYNALIHYSAGIAMHSDGDTVLLKTLFRNRAVENLFLGRHDATLADAKLAILTTADAGVSSATIVLKNTETLMRAGRASYLLGEFAQALSYFDDAAALSSHDSAPQHEQRRTAVRLDEAETGNYDFKKMKEKISPKSPLRVDHASFTKYVEVRRTQTRGRGLFAAKDFAAGDLIMCEKALEIGPPPRTGEQTRALAIAPVLRIYSHAHVSLANDLARRIRNNPSLFARFFDLSAGEEEYKPVLHEIEGEAVIDENHILDIVTFNAFPLTTERKFEPVADPTTSGCIVGLWLTASFINHACDGNAMRAFEGDMMIVRATKSIKQGDEILMPYVVIDTRSADGIAATLKAVWRFECECAVCRAEDRVSAHDKRFRKLLYEKGLELLLTNKLQKQEISTEQLNQMHALYRRYERTYDPAFYANVPRVGLSKFAFLLGHHYFIAKRYEECIRCGFDAMKDMGYVVEIDAEHVTIDRSKSLHSSEIVVTMLDIAKSYDALGKVLLAKEFTEIARISYMAFNGHDLQFEDDRKPTANFIWTAPFA